MNNTITFGAVGDVAFARQTSEEILRHGYDWPFEKVRDQLKRADLLFGNMESIALPDNFPMDKLDPAGLVTPLNGPKLAASLHRAGFDVMNMAANHVLDGGSIGMEYTRKCLEEAGIVAGGVGANKQDARLLRVVERGNIRFGFLFYAENSNWTLGQKGPGHAVYTLDNVLDDVKAHRNEVDVLVVSIHADMEFMPTPSTGRIANCRKIAGAGADIILQHHPHVPQGIEMVDGCLVAYSLGNMIFDSVTSTYQAGNSPHTADVYILLMEVSKNGVHSFERVSGKLYPPPEQRPHPLSGKKAEEMLAYFEELDGLLHDEDFVKKTWRKFARKRFFKLLERACEEGEERVMRELLGRIFFVAENRACADEVLAEARELWDEQLKSYDPYRRPNYRFQKPQGKPSRYP